MSLIYTRMSSLCHLYVLVCHPYLTRMWFYHEPFSISKEHSKKNRPENQYYWTCGKLSSHWVKNMSEFKIWSRSVRKSGFLNRNSYWNRKQNHHHIPQHIWILNKSIDIILVRSVGKENFHVSLFKQIT